jgi:hypothetical protein
LNRNRSPSRLHMLRKRIHIPRSERHRNLIPHILGIVHQVLSFPRVDTDDTEHQLTGHSEGYGFAILFQDGLWQVGQRRVRTMSAYLSCSVGQQTSCPSRRLTNSLPHIDLQRLCFTQFPLLMCRDPDFRQWSLFGQDELGEEHDGGVCWLSEVNKEECGGLGV